MNGLVLFDPAVSVRLCLVLVHSLWQVALLAAVAWLVGRWWRGRPVEWSHRLYVAALVLSLVALPVTYMVVDVPTTTVPANLAATEPVAGADGVVGRMLPMSTPGAEVARGDDLAGEPAMSATTVSGDQAAGAAWSAVWRRAAPWLAGLYVGGVLVMLGRLAAGIIRVERLRGLATPITGGPLAESLRRLAERWSMRTVPALLQAEHIVVPKVVGLVKPAILFPTAAIAGLSIGELEMILAHELAHVRRYDVWINLLQRLAEVVLFFNPALWLLNRQISLLREYCCDELACGPAGGGDAEPRLRYAEALVRAVQLATPDRSRHNDLAALAAGGRSPSELRRRLARLFGEPLQEPVRLSRGGMVALGAVVLLLWVPALWPAKADEAKRVDDGRVDEGPEPGTTTFSCGAKLELIAIGTNQAQPQVWWNAKGEREDHPGLTIQGASVSADDDEVARQIVFRIRDLPESADVKHAVEPVIAAAWGEPVVGGEAGPPGYYSEVFSLPRDVTEFRLRVAVAAGPWQHVVEAQSAGSSSFGLPSGRSVAFSPTMQSEWGTSVVVTHNFRSEDTRLIAIDMDGQRRSPIRSSTDAVGEDAVQTTWTFSERDASPIDHFEFETRSFEWVEIPGLPASANRSTDGPADAASARATISGKIVLEDGSPAPVKGELMYYSRFPSKLDPRNTSAANGAVDQFTDSFSCEIPAGTVRLAYYPDDYAPTWLGPFELAPGEQLADVTITLKPGFSEKLILEDEDGQRVPGATVVASPSGEEVFASPVHELKTDDQGELLLEHLADVKYEFTITAPGYQPLRTQPLRVEQGDVLRPTMVRSNPALGIIRWADGTPAPLTKLRALAEFPKNGHVINYANEGGGFWGKTLVTTDEHGRFRMDQLTEGSRYLFVIDTMDYARAIVDNLQAGEKNVQIVLPQRLDLVVDVKGDITNLPQRGGRPFVSVRQPVHVTRPDGTGYNALVGGDVTLEPTPGGGQAIFRGLAIDLRKDAPQQTVRVGLGYDEATWKTVDVNRDGTTVVRFELPQKQNGEGEADEAADEAEPGDGEKAVDADGANAAKPVDLYVVVARHVLLLDGKEIITWQGLEDRIAALADPSLAYPHFYITRGARESGVAKTAKDKMYELHGKYKLQGHSEGSLWPQADLRYDRIETAADLVPDESLRVEGRVVDRQGQPMAGAEVLLVTPVDESIAYQTYHVALVRGKVRNRLEHVMAVTDGDGRFALYPPKDTKTYFVALHPDEGFQLTQGDRFEAGGEIRLLSWAGLDVGLDQEPGERETPSLSTRIAAVDGRPEIELDQDGGVLQDRGPDAAFRFTRVPPIFETSISRCVAEPEGGGQFCLPGVSLGLLPGEVRRIDLGPLTDQQRSYLQSMRERSR